MVVLILLSFSFVFFFLFCFCFFTFIVFDRFRWSVASFPALGTGGCFPTLEDTACLFCSLCSPLEFKCSLSFINILISLDVNHSKKDTEQRQKELLEGISPALLQLVEKNVQELIFDKGGCQLLLATLLKCTGKCFCFLFCFVMLLLFLLSYAAA